MASSHPELRINNTNSNRNNAPFTVQPRHETTYSNVLNAQSHGKKSHKKWAVQPTEQTRPSRNAYAIGKHDIKKKYIVHGVKRRSSSLNTTRIDHIYQDPHEKKRGVRE